MDSTPPRKLRLPLIAAGAVALVLVGGGAFAWSKLSGGGTQPEDVLPADVVAYVRLDLDPSASQKLEMMRLLRKMPVAAQELGLDSDDVDLREKFVEMAFADCDLDFNTHVEPWLGERVGFGGLANGEDSALVLQVDDEDRARAGIKAFDDCAEQDPSGVVFRNGYALVADNQKMAERIARAADKGTLGERKDFQQAMDSVGEHGVASAWLDFRAMVNSPAIREEFGIPEDFKLLKAFEKTGPMTATLRADGNALELHGITRGVSEIVGKGEIRPARIAKDAVLVAGWSFPDELIDITVTDGPVAGMPALGQPLTADELAELTATFGIDLMKEVPVLAGADPLFVVGRRGLENVPFFAGPDDVKDLDISLRLRGDSAKLRELLGRIAPVVEEIMSVKLVVEASRDGAVLATSSDYSADGTGLADHDAYSAVAPGDERLTSLFYVNIDELTSVIEEWDMPDIEEFMENLAPLTSFAMTSAGDGFSLKLAFD